MSRCRYCKLELSPYDASYMQCPHCKRFFGYGVVYDDLEYKAFLEDLLEVPEDEHYHENSMRLWEEWYYSRSDAEVYYDQVYADYKKWLYSELDTVEAHGWECTGSDFDYYAFRDTREGEIKQLVGSPYDYYLTLLNNDTEYYKEWALLLRNTTETE